MKVHIQCIMCPESVNVEAPSPEGWDLGYGGEVVDEESALCPKHKTIAQFRSAQCPGCVGSFGDCDLFASFAYSHRRSVGEPDFIALEHGVCPRRTNGTFFTDHVPGKPLVFAEIDDSSPEVEGGKAMAQGIRDYLVRYPDA